MSQTQHNNIAECTLLILDSIGRPGRLAALRDFVNYIGKKEGVWVATRTEIAEAFKEKHPYKKGQLA